MVQCQKLKFKGLIHTFLNKSLWLCNVKNWLISRVLCRGGYFACLRDRYTFNDVEETARIKSG